MDTEPSIENWKVSYEAWKRMLQKDLETRRKQNSTLLRKRVRLLNKKKGPRVGDWMILKNGVMTRFTHDWGFWRKEDLGIQIGDRERTGDCGSFYLGDGYCSYSGSLDPPILHKNLRRTNNKKLGRVWFFDHDHAFANNGIDFEIKFRVYKEVRDEKIETH